MPKEPPLNPPEEHRCEHSEECTPLDPCNHHLAELMDEALERGDF